MRTLHQLIFIIIGVACLLSCSVVHAQTGTQPCLLTIPPDEVCSFLPDNIPPPCCPPGYWLYCDPCTLEPIRCLPPDCEYPPCAFQCPPVVCNIPSCPDAVDPVPGCDCDPPPCLPSCWVETKVQNECVGPDESYVYTFDVCVIDCTDLDNHWQVCDEGTNIPYTVLSDSNGGDTFCVQATGSGQLTVINLAHDGSCETYSIEERVDVPARCRGDLNGDGNININDLLRVLVDWGNCHERSPCDGECCPADCNGDGSVGIDDLLCVLSAWGPCVGLTPTDG